MLDEGLCKSCGRQVSMIDEGGIRSPHPCVPTLCAHCGKNGHPTRSCRQRPDFIQAARKYVESRPEVTGGPARRSNSYTGPGQHHRGGHYNYRGNYGYDNGWNTTRGQSTSRGYPTSRGRGRKLQFGSQFLNPQ